MGFETDIETLKNIVRVGTVSSVDVKSRTARVFFSSYNNMVSGPLKVVNQKEPWLPEVKQGVVCLYLPHGECDGFVLGAI